MEKNAFVKVLEAELIPALGCTEPVAFALTAATARKYAPGEIKRISMEGSGLMVIGVQSVGIPNTGGKCGGFLSTLLGVLAGDADLDMEVLSKVTDTDVKAAEELIEQLVAAQKLDLDMVTPAPSIYLKITIETDQHTASVSLWNEHNGIKFIEQDGKVLLGNREEEKEALANQETIPVDTSFLSVETIYDFCSSCDISDLDHIKTAIELTRGICKDGLDNEYGLQVARTLQQKIDQGLIADDEITHVLKWTVAGLDARMGGSGYTAMSNTGSGNQGIISSMAPIAAADFRKCSEEEMIRAVAMSNLVNIYLDYKSNEYAHLSPMCYCSGVATASAASGVAFLRGATKEQISDMIRTSLGNLAGVICDGAKPSCAFRSYTGLSGALQAMLMAERGLSSSDVEGIVNKSVDGTIENIYRLQKECMSNTDAFVFKVKRKQGTIC
ncbi:L-serine ammonia-lyase, iron-sulfur-dependent, subunit alpha [Vibrio sp. DW001]|uniref:L-cysteine desulfidase family protein n=1 Tax=Vibrio sp. DW001 TaxID=2912315 RepID=UPI0023AE6F0D|nr:L-serine ammonia-lyase, iron-sulfur-dependent, subunit alpha [Vibrio sp. DW001]WED27636.1 L-serine ammonia-lyase, iron-sulfur-dependent, subunit alpha [Vibrio sp. DW001]